MTPRWGTDKPWTADKPSSPGWYWWRSLLGDVEVVKIGYIGKVAVVYGHGSDGLRLEHQGPGEWLGPITPDAYAAGRVAGIKEVQQYAHDECFVPCAGKDLWQRGHNAAALHIFNHCQKLIEAQAQGGEHGTV